MFSRWTTLASLAAGLVGLSDASAQGYGYGYGQPNYMNIDLNAYLSHQMAQTQAQMNAAIHEQNRIVQKAQQQSEAMVQQAMQRPDIRKRYEEFRQAGGNLNLRDYTYWHLATRGFSREGIDAYNAVENRNIAKEREAIRGVREAEKNLQETMQEGRDRFFENHKEMGNILAGNRTYIDDQGMKHQLNYTKPGISEDQTTGNYYKLDQQGTYWIKRPGDWFWYEMTPAK